MEPQIDASGKRYEITCAKIRHEDGLINQRLTWLLTAEGLLFAAYGIVYNAQVRASLNAGAGQAFAAEAVRIGEAVAFAGVTLACVVLLGVVAALSSILRAQEWWRRQRRPDESSLPEPLGRSPADFLGSLPQTLLPVVFALTWLLIVRQGWPFVAGWIVFGLAVLLVLLVFLVPFLCSKINGRRSERAGSS